MVVDGKVTGDGMDYKGWVPVSTGKMPEIGKYVLLSFRGWKVPEVGRLEKDGMFYMDTEMRPVSYYGLEVNAWMTLPTSYRGPEATFDRA